MIDCSVTSDFASVAKKSKYTILLKPKNQYANTELNNDRFNKLYSFYVGLLLEQYAEDIGQNMVLDQLKAGERE